MGQKATDLSETAGLPCLGQPGFFYCIGSVEILYQEYADAENFIVALLQTAMKRRPAKFTTTIKTIQD